MEDGFDRSWVRFGCGALFAATLITGCGGGSEAPPASTPTPAPAPAPAPPVAAFAAPAVAAANVPVPFDAAGSTSSSGGALTFSWVFGNGNRGGGRSIAQVFGSGGTYHVTLTVTDAQGRTGTVTQAIAITPPPAPPRTQAVQGEVKDLAGGALAGVSATVVGGAGIANSDAAGRLALTLGVGVPVTLKLSKSGYADQIVSLAMPATVGTDAHFEARMLPREAAQPLADAAAGGAVTGKDGARLTLPADALVDGAGMAVAGPVQVALTPVDITRPAGGGFPGRFEGVNANATVTPIMSFGTTEFVLSRNGAPLQLAPGRTATIELPVYADRRPDGTLLAAGDTLPLWSLDEHTGAWINEGQGTLVAAASSPTGLAMRATVAHLSWWNADIGFEPFGPQPRCVYDTDIGIPGAGDQFATATVCNMLAEIDRGPGTAPVVPADRVRAAAAAPPRFPGFARTATVPIAGGVTIAVPANVDVALSATALNGAWTGRTVVNGPVGEQREIVVLMRPLAGGSGTEALTLPFDGQRAAQSGQTARYTFSAAAARWARVTATRANGSNLEGTARLLQGATVLASGAFAIAPAQIVTLLPADGTYTIEVTGTANTPGGYRLQVELVGGVQEETLTLPFDAARSMPAFTQFRGTFDIAARTAVSIVFQRRFGAAASWRLRAPDGSIVAADVTAPLPDRDAVSVLLPTAGRYAIEAAVQNGGAFEFHVTAESTPWMPVAPSNPIVEYTSDFVDLMADRNGVPVIVYVRRSVVNNEVVQTVLLRRWDGSAWVDVAPDLPAYARPCSPGNGFSTVGATFDLNNDPIVVYGDVEAGVNGGAKFNILRYSAGGWQGVGPDNGVLPRRSVYSSACAAPPVVKVGADNAPIVAYRADNDTVIQKLSGAQWVGLVTPAGDTFTSIYGTFDLQLDPGGRVVFAWGGNNDLALTALRLRTSPLPAAWEPLGPNGGLLPLPAGTRSISNPRIRFDAAGNPVIGAAASVYVSPGVFTGGTAVYRFDGAAWQGSGGYRISADSYANSAGDMGFTLFEGDAVMGWVNARQAGGIQAVVQRNTAAGWTGIGSNDGAIPQFHVHALTTSSAWSLRPLAVGSELYLALVERVEGTTALQRIRLLRYVR